MVRKREAKKEEVVEVKKDSTKTSNGFVKFISKNYWMIATVLLAVLLVVVLIYNSTAAVSADTAGQKLIDFASSQGVELTIINVTSRGGFYEILAEIQGQQAPFYITKDGKYFTASILDLSEISDSPGDTNPPAQTQPEDVPKSDKPVVELFVWGYCPYGVQAQGPMAEVASLLKADADFKIVPYYDGHGPFELQQNKIQLCIQKLYPEKYWPYATKFVADVYNKCGSTREVECDTTESAKTMKAVGIDSAKVMSCVKTDGDAMYNSAKSRAQQSGVSGFPTVTINGVIVNVARTADAYKTAICSAFNNAPSACSTVLDSSAATASGNC